MARNVARNSKKQTGTPNTKRIGGSQKRTNTVDPWGPIVPDRRIGRVNGIGQSMRSAIAKVRGSSTRKPTPDASLRGMQYAKNDPTQWPVVPDPTTGLMAQDPFGINSEVISNVNASIEQAYTRDGYQ